MNDWKSYEKPDEEELRRSLTPEQFDVTQCSATEAPFQNEYWDNHEEGIYVDVVSGAPLFSSTDKYDSGTGWPSFTKPITTGTIKTADDETLRVHRVEAKSESSGAHLGHIFEDGPKETGGLRYCMNSAALRFVPKAEMEQAGYGEYLSLFKD